MIRNRIIILILYAVYVPFLSFAVEERPPSSAIIYQTLDRLWNEREYFKANRYVRELHSKWPTYVPVGITLGIYNYQYGAQVEDSISVLKRLREKLNADISIASPIFMELLDSRITRYERLERFYLEQGISREQRLAERNPLKKTPFNHAKRWVGVDEMLYFNAPEVFLDESGVRSVDKDRIERSTSALEQAAMNTLQGGVGDDKKPMPERKAFAQEIVRRRGAAGGVSNLVQGLRAGDVSYTYQDTVEVLVKFGPAAIPELIEYINNPAHFPWDQKMAIWALVRIGVADPIVIKTFEAISSNSERADLAKYAQDALRYLQSESR